MPDIVYWILGYMAIGAARTLIDILYGMARGNECFAGSVRGGLIWPFTIALLVLLGLAGGVIWTVRAVHRLSRKDPKANA